MTLSSDLIIWLQFRSFRAQSCPTLCDPLDCSPPGSSVNGIFWARILEWAAMPFSRGSSWPRDWTRVFCTAGRFFTTKPPWKPDLLTRWPVYKKEYTGKTEGRRRREWQRMRWLDSITRSLDAMLPKLRETVADKRGWRATVDGVSEGRTQLSDWTTTPVRNSQTEERHWARHGRRDARPPRPFWGPHSPSSCMSSATWKLPEPQSSGIFMEASLDRHDQVLTQFPALLQGWKFQTSNHSLVFTGALSQAEASKSLLIRTIGTPTHPNSPPENNRHSYHPGHS